MKILFLVKFFQPFDRGGSEWSTNDLAVNLIEKGHKIIILTPNYGAKNREIKNGFEIIRIPFPIKLKNVKDSIAPFWTNNLIWFIYSSLFCFWVTLKNKPQIIHIQNNELIPAGIVCSTLRKIPSVVTFRDYQALCNLGFCLWESKKACNLKKYIARDFSFFYQNYVSGRNGIKYLVMMLAVIRAKIMQIIILLFARKATFRIAVSKKVSEIFKANEVVIDMVIHNVVNISSKPSMKPKDEIIYVGKLSKGKGVDLLFKELPALVKNPRIASFKIIGSGYLEKDLKKFTRVNNLNSKVKFEGQLDHRQVLEEIKKTSLVVIPSVWQEPLSRSLIETLLSGTPVVATNVGGNEEIIKKSYGIVVNPESGALREGIIRAFENRDRLKANLLKDLDFLRNHFSKETTSDYQKVYLTLTDNNK